MRITLRTSRAAALLAASTLGCSTLVLGVAGVASASPVQDFTFSTDASDGADHTVGLDHTLTIPAGYCSIDWTVDGAPGSADGDGTAGDDGVEVNAHVDISGAQSFMLYPGTTGQDAVADDSQATPPTPGTPGTGGTGHVAGDDGQGGQGSSDPYGGGGGGATEVDDAHGAVVIAPGGNGGGSAGGHGGGTALLPAGATTGTSGGGPGAVYGTVNACPTVTLPPAPDAPRNFGVSSGDRSLHLSFLPYESGDTYEYSLNGGTSWHALTVTQESGQYDVSGDVTGLTNGTTYAVEVREDNAGGAGTPTASVNATPAVPAGAPSGVAVTTAPSAFTVTWAAATPGTFPIVGYEVYVSDPLAQSGGQACQVMTDPTARSCTVAAIPGHDYGVVVVADDDHGNSGVGSASVQTGKVPGAAAPAAVPAGAGTMSTPSGAVGQLAAGQSVTLTGSGYAPNSTVDLYVYSTPRKIGTVVTDASGNFTVTVTVPADLAPGAHHLVATGVDPSGAVRYLRVDVTVNPATGQLAWTGFEALPFAGAGVAALALGGGLVAVSRRRRTA